MKKLFLVIGLVLALTMNVFAIYVPYDYHLGFSGSDDEDFVACINSLDTPAEICQYMEDNFTWTFNEDDYSPYEEWYYGDGDCADMACFATAAAWRQSYTTYRIHIKYVGIEVGHVLGVYVDGSYDYSSNDEFYNVNKSTFLQVVNHHLGLVNKTLDWYRVFDVACNVVEYGE